MSQFPGTLYVPGKFQLLVLFSSLLLLVLLPMSVSVWLSVTHSISRKSTHLPLLQHPFHLHSSSFITCNYLIVVYLFMFCLYHSDEHWDQKVLFPVVSQLLHFIVFEWMNRWSVTLNVLRLSTKDILALWPFHKGSYISFPTFVPLL